MHKNNNYASKAFLNFPVRTYSSLINKYLPSVHVSAGWKWCRKPVHRWCHPKLPISSQKLMAETPQIVNKYFKIFIRRLNTLQSHKIYISDNIWFRCLERDFSKLKSINSEKRRNLSYDPQVIGGSAVQCIQNRRRSIQSNTSNLCE